MSLRPTIVSIAAISLILSGQTGCSKIEEYQALDGRIEALQEETEKLEAEVDALESENRRLDHKLRKNRNIDRILEEEIEEAQPSIDFMADLIAGVDFYEAKLNAWREATRASFVGARIDRLQLVDGETLHSVTIQEVEDENVTFILPGGTPRTVPCSNLPKPFLRRIAHESTIIEDAASL